MISRYFAQLHLALVFYLLFPLSGISFPFLFFFFFVSKLPVCARSIRNACTLHHLPFFLTRSKLKLFHGICRGIYRYDPLLPAEEAIKWLEKVDASDREPSTANDKNVGRESSRWSSWALPRDSWFRVRLRNNKQRRSIPHRTAEEKFSTREWKCSRHDEHPGSATTSAIAALNSGSRAAFRGILKRSGCDNSRLESRLNCRMPARLCRLRETREMITYSGS